MITIKLNTNVDSTRDFQRLLRQKLEEGIFLFFRDKYRNDELEIDFEVIKQTDDYNKDAKLVIKNIKNKNKEKK